MNGWTPLHQQIVGSSVWGTSYHVRIAWVTLLAITGKDGVAHVTTGGLARLANITPKEAEDALRVLSEPDPDTLTQEHEGRRIERVETGWRLLNWEKYRALAKKAIVGEQNRVAVARYRERQRGGGLEQGQEQEMQEGTRPLPMGRVRGSNRPASAQEVVDYGQVLGVADGPCRKFYDHYESTAKEDPSGRIVWVTGRDGEKLVGNWKNLLAMWKANQEERAHEKKVNQRDRKEAQKEGGPPVQLKVQSFNPDGQKTEVNATV